MTRKEIRQEAKEILQKLIDLNTAGYFYEDNKRINFSSIYGWYCKDFENGHIRTYNISQKEALKKVESSLMEDI
jgi:hypothetical protein